MFFEKWNDTENPKKKSEKRELAQDKWYNRRGQVGTSWSRGTNGTRRRGSSDLSGTSRTRRRGSSDLRGTSGTKTMGLSTWTIPLVPNGTTRPWKLLSIPTKQFTNFRTNIVGGEPQLFLIKIWNHFQIFQFKGLSTWPMLKFMGKDFPSNVIVGPFEGSHRIAAVRHPWLISGGGLSKTRGGFSAEC